MICIIGIQRNIDRESKVYFKIRTIIQSNLFFYSKTKLGLLYLTGDSGNVYGSEIVLFLE